MTKETDRRDDDQDITIDAGRDDWEWRRKIRSNPHSHLIYRIVVGVVGTAIFVLGLIMVPFPGPGWLVVLLGLAVLASEFRWAHGLLQRSKHTLRVWNDWVQPQPWWVKGLVLLVTGIAVAAIFWALFLISGVPPFFPDSIEQWIRGVPGLEH
ncbi:MAG: TIGR02611 family protein [Dermatophilaceae bacterium]|nr:TIGR02611 family protein [Dermatophilaceae bacterium]